MAPSRFVAVFSSDPDGTLALAQQLSPRVELHPPDGILLEISVRNETAILERLRQAADASWSVGAASTRTTALLAARVGSGNVVPPGREGDFLAAVPVKMLFLQSATWRPELALALARWGIRTLGELAALPESELAARLGQEGVRLQRMARGEDIKPFQPYPPERRLEASRELEWTLDSLEPLTFVLADILEQLCSQLQSHGLAVEALEVNLKLEDQTVYSRMLRLAFPLSDPKVLLSLVRLDLQSHPPQAGIVGVATRAFSGPPRIFQYTLFQPLTLTPDKLARTVARLCAVVGEENVGSPLLLDSHRPDAFTLEALALTPTSGPAQSIPPQVALRRLRPPVPSRIRPEQARACAGPWLSSGDWWNALEWSREEWDIESLDGALCRIYRDQGGETWFVEGVYD